MTCSSDHQIELKRITKTLKILYEHVYHVVHVDDLSIVPIKWIPKCLIAEQKQSHMKYYVQSMANLKKI